mgnify:CR=1 FL=1
MRHPAGKQPENQEGSKVGQNFTMSYLDTSEYHINIEDTIWR